MQRRVQPRRLDGPPDYLDERAYQQQVKEAFDRIYGEVEIQWRPFRGEGRGIYAPIVDIAVGPFAITRRYIDEYGELLDQTRAFIERLIGKHNENCEGREENARFEDIRNFNENARCLLCIEIEESGTRKHCLGNLVNASALGRIGILVRVRHRYSERSYDSARTSTSWQRYKKIPLKLEMLWFSLQNSSPNLLPRYRMRRAKDYKHNFAAASCPGAP
jgi:hypothetical protein